MYALSIFILQGTRTSSINMPETNGKMPTNQNEPEQYDGSCDVDPAAPPDGGCDVDPAAAPDGGWGWMVVLSSFMVSFLVDGVCFTFGIFFPFFLDNFGESKGKTQILGSVLNGSYLSLGRLTTLIVHISHWVG